jgi:hypothetical protein
MSKKVVTGRVRFSYFNAFKPRLNTLSNKSEFSTQILVPKSDVTTIAAIKAAISEAVTDKFGGKRPVGLRNPLKNGDAIVDEGATALGKEYAGHYYFSAKASEDKPPQIVDAEGQSILSAQEFGSGDYGRVSVTFYGYDQKVNKGVSAWLNNIQFLEKGEALDGRSTAEEDFAQPIKKAAPKAAAPVVKTAAPKKPAVEEPETDEADSAEEDWA